MIMILGIDIASQQHDLDLTIPWSQGYRACYVKMGGDNNPRYIAPNYVAQVDRARGIGYQMGHYWVPEDSMDPNGAADFYVANLRGWKSSDFCVLDNESYLGNDPDGSGPQTNSTPYSDAQAAAWVERVKVKRGVPGNQVLVYYMLADARARDHSRVLATGANFIIAAYSYAPFTFAAPSNIPMSRIVGHQTGGALFGGIATDVNSFKDNAFNYSTNRKPNMYLLRILDGTVYLVTDSGMAPIASPSHLALIQRMFNSYPSYDTFNATERDIIHGYIKAASTADDVETAKILSALTNITANVDTDAVIGALVPEVVSAVRAEMVGIDIVDEEAIAVSVRNKFRTEPLS